MAAFSTLTLSQLKVATATQIATALKAKIDTLNKRQLVNLVLAIRDYNTDTEQQIVDAQIVTSYPDGQAKSTVTIIRDVLGNQIGSKRVDWTYYPPQGKTTQGAVDTIRVSELDATDVVVKQQVVKHYMDGRQPVIL